MALLSRYGGVFALSLFLCCSPAQGLAVECGSPGNWKDIALLPTNGNPDKNINITLSLDKTEAKPGDYVVVTFQADRDCFLTLMNEGTSGKILRLWPNKYSGTSNFVAGNTRKQFPGPTDEFKYRIALPAGTERIVAYATSEKDKILAESDFQALRNTAFKQLRLKSKDLEAQFRENTDPGIARFAWGTAQVNLCVRSEAEERASPTGIPADATVPGGDRQIWTAPSQDTLQSDGAGGADSAPLTGKTVLLAAGAPTEGLKYSAHDAKRFAQVAQSLLNIKPDDVKLLLNHEATYDGFVSGLKWLESKTGPEDSVIIYFSGHGTSIPDTAPLDEKDGRDECFVMDFSGPKVDWKQALERKVIMKDDDFNALLKRIPARKKIVVVDACHSGTISKKVDGQTCPLVSKFLAFPDPETGQETAVLKSKAIPTNYGNDHEALLSACRDDQMSYEDQSRGAGLFTYHLINALEKGTANFETAFKAARDITERESEVFRRQYGQSVTVQTPILTDPHHYVRLFGKRR